ncbi:MAG: hypothetical protein WBD74_11540 [Candidatus Aquilonibacter sp.]
MRRGFALLLLASLAACAGNDPQSAANGVTRGVYDNNLSAVQPYFDDALRPQVSRAGVGVISDKMLAMGSYNGLTFLGSDTTKREYSYRANFSKGTMNVVVRVDPDGRLAAYRVFPSSS